MSNSITTVVEPFVRRGLFTSPEQAVTEMAREYVLRQVEHYQAVVQSLESRYGMRYEQFESYLKSRSATLTTHPDPILNRAIMEEEEDALDWKTALEMMSNWLGLQQEVKD